MKFSNYYKKNNISQNFSNNRYYKFINYLLSINLGKDHQSGISSLALSIYKQHFDAVSISNNPLWQYEISLYSGKMIIYLNINYKNKISSLEMKMS